MTAKSKLVVFMAAICLVALALGLTGYAFAVDGTGDSSGAQYGPAPTDPVPPADTGGTVDATTPPADPGGAAGDQYGPPPIPPTTDPLPPADTGDDDSDDGSALPPADDEGGDDDGDVSYQNHGDHVSDVARDHDAHASRDLPNGHVSDNHGHAVSQAAHDHSGESEHGQASHGENRHAR